MICIKNTIIISALFLILICFIYSWENSTIKLLKDIEKTADKLELQFNSKDYESATKTSNELYDFWESKVIYLEMILNHSDVNVLTEEILKLTQYSKEKADPDGLASIHYIKSLVNRMMNIHRISIQNIL